MYYYSLQIKNGIQNKKKTVKSVAISVDTAADEQLFNVTERKTVTLEAQQWETHNPGVRDTSIQ
jgi:hypothetical protein